MAMWRARPALVLAVAATLSCGGNEPDTDTDTDADYGGHDIWGRARGLAPVPADLSPGWMGFQETSFGETGGGCFVESTLTGTALRDDCDDCDWAFDVQVSDSVFVPDEPCYYGLGIEYDAANYDRTVGFGYQSDWFEEGVGFQGKLFVYSGSEGWTPVGSAVYLEGTFAYDWPWYESYYSWAW